MLQVGDVCGIQLVVLLELDLFLFECLGHGTHFDEELVDSFLLIEEGSIERVADVDDVGFTDGDDFLDGLIVVLAGQEESEMCHRDGSEGHRDYG